jgi:hypothetical protein
MVVDISEWLSGSLITGIGVLFIARWLANV